MSEHKRPSHPFADLIGLTFESAEPGTSRCRVPIRAELLNPHGVVHGAVAYALADTGMGGALYPLLEKAESCATIEIKIVYLSSAREGDLVPTGDNPNCPTSFQSIENAQFIRRIS